MSGENNPCTYRLNILVSKYVKILVKIKSTRTVLWVISQLVFIFIVVDNIGF